MANFLFTLGKGDVEAATRCFQFANVAHSKVNRGRSESAGQNRHEVGGEALEPSPLRSKE